MMKFTFLLRALLTVAVLPFVAAAQQQAAPEAIAADAVVAADGSGQYKSVQAAINAAPYASRERPWVIRVKAGVYNEIVYVQRERGFMKLLGEGADRTRITFALFAGMKGPDGKPIGTFRTPTVQIDGDDFTVEDMTIENAAGRVGQALALRVDGDRVAFRRCTFIGWQDTILANRGRHYFEDCRIVGATDFIFGAATAYFNRCDIVCVGGGYVTAASTPKEQLHGFVFSKCRISGATPDLRTFLGRPWRDHAEVVFIDTEMTEVVRPEGWHNWGKPEREKTVRYAEAGNTGPGAAPATRVSWARRLTPEEATRFSVAEILGGPDGWLPFPAEKSSK